MKKYRIWDIRKQKMVYNALILSETGQLITVNETYFNDPFALFDGCKWMQYVEAEDKQGTGIYEGDVFEWNNLRGVVEFKDGCFVFETNHSSMTLRDHSAKEFEIIGNIYENNILF